MDVSGGFKREQFFELVDLLGSCPEPYLVAGHLMVDALGIADELRQEMGHFLDDMILLARREKVSLPEADISALRQDVHQLGQLRERYGLDLLFSHKTRDSCGRQAAPLLAMALLLVENQVTYGTEFLERVEGYRSILDAVLPSDRFSGSGSAD